MNRRGFVKALAALPAAALGAVALPKLASPETVAPEVVAGPLYSGSLTPELFDDFLRRTVHLRVLDGIETDPFDEWLALLADHGGDFRRYIGGTHLIETPTPDLRASCRIDGKEIVGTVESFDIDFRREVAFGEISEPEFRVSPTTHQTEIIVKVKVDDRMSERLAEISAEFEKAAEEVAERFREMEFQMFADSIFPDDGHQIPAHERRDPAIFEAISRRTGIPAEDIRRTREAADRLWRDDGLNERGESMGEWFARKGRVDR